MAAGLAPNIYLLIVFRIIQGIGGGVFLPAATAMVSDAFGERRAPAIGLFGSIFPIGGILGPNIGGFIVDNFSWRWVFYVNVPVGVLLFLCGMAFLPKSNKSAHKNQKLDFVGTGLFIGGVLAVLYGITNWANNPGRLGTMVMTWVLFTASLIFFSLFVWYENRISQPMIEIKLLRWRPFLAANIYNFIFGAVVFGFFSFIPYYAKVAYGMSAGQAGLILTPRSLAMVVTSAVVSIFIIRLRYRLPMIIGVVLISLSLFLLSRGYHDLSVFGFGLHNLVVLTLLILISGIGMGVANPASNNAALDLIPERVAAVAGVRGMFRVVGGIIGTAVVTLVLSYFPDKALGMQNIYLVFSVLILLVIPLVFLIPDRARQP